MLPTVYLDECRFFFRLLSWHRPSEPKRRPPHGLGWWERLSLYAGFRGRAPTDLAGGDA